jgi:hypothetical protein
MAWGPIEPGVLRPVPPPGPKPSGSAKLERILESNRSGDRRFRVTGCARPGFGIRGRPSRIQGCGVFPAVAPRTELLSVSEVARESGRVGTARVIRTGGVKLRSGATLRPIARLLTCRL